ncbi:MAG: tetratricopeptide repeat protein [Bacteroidota bacterium]|nr:tetratricopeptide repeat protein [Bacteroidota bacterium]
MANNYNKNKNIKKQSPVTVKTINNPNQSLYLTEKKRNMKIIWFILLLTVITYSNSLTNQFIYNWDDGGYVVEHKPIQKVTAENIKYICFGTHHADGSYESPYYKGNYHPLTTLFYMFEYNVFGLHSTPYHIINLLFHLMNIILVFYLINRLSKKLEVAVVTALFFAIHPMHVESVSWISELKDVLYCFFYLLSIKMYLDYLDKKKEKRRYYFYLISILLFFLSLTSKSAAVSLTVNLFVIDYLMKRKISTRMFVEKIPYFILSVTFGLIAMFSQKAAGALQDIDSPLFSAIDRIFLASYSTMYYIIMMFFPFHFSAMHPYPDKSAGHLPYEYYITPLLIIGIIIFLWKTKILKREAIFGMTFFFFAIALVLQFLPVGGAIVAERYTYVPYIGSFFVIGSFYSYVKNNIKFSKTSKNMFTYILGAWALAFVGITFMRNFDWKDGEVLFKDVIKKYPNMAFAYNNLGYYYYTREPKQFDKSLDQYNQSIKVDSTFHRALSNRGVLYFNIAPLKGDSAPFCYKQAIIDFTKALKYKGDNTDALIGRANTLSQIGRYKEALPDYNHYLRYIEKANDTKIDDIAKAYQWRGTAYLKTNNPDSAMLDFDHALKLEPGNGEALYWKGLVYYNKNDFPKAIEYFNQSTSVNPKFADPYSWRGLALSTLKRHAEAIKDFSMAVQLNPHDVPSLINRAYSYSELGKYKESYNDLITAKKYGYPVEQIQNGAYFAKIKHFAGVPN